VKLIYAKGFLQNDFSLSGLEIICGHEIIMMKKVSFFSLYDLPIVCLLAWSKQPALSACNMQVD